MLTNSPWGDVHKGRTEDVKRQSKASYNWDLFFLRISSKTKYVFLERPARGEFLSDIMEEEFESRIPLNHFYRAFCVYIRKPHVVNSKLRYTTNLLFLKLDRDKWDAGEKDELVKVLRVTAESTNADRGSFTESLSRQGQIFEEKDLDDLNSFDESDKDLYLSIDRNFPKSNKFKSCYVATFIGMNAFNFITT